MWPGRELLQQARLRCVDVVASVISFLTHEFFYFSPPIRISVIPLSTIPPLPPPTTLSLHSLTPLPLHPLSLSPLEINNPHSTEPVLCPSELDMLERSEQLACGNGKSGGDEVAALGVVDEESGSVFSMEEEEEYHGPQLLGKSASASIVSDEDLMDKALKRAKMISGRDANGEWF